MSSMLKVSRIGLPRLRTRSMKMLPVVPQLRSACGR
jgi:hypothetical protein